MSIPGYSKEKVGRQKLICDAHSLKTGKLKRVFSAWILGCVSSGNICLQVCDKTKQSFCLELRKGSIQGPWYLRTSC